MGDEVRSPLGGETPREEGAEREREIDMLDRHTGAALVQRRLGVAGGRRARLQGDECAGSFI